MDPSKVSACLVTRGDVDMTPIIELLPFDNVVVWNNFEREDMGIFGRYAAIAEAEHDVIVTQDDDLIVTDWPSILAAYQPGVLTVSYPHPWDIPWVARGAIFDRDLPEKSFQRYDRLFPRDRYFTHYACDGIFALLTDKVNVVDYGSEDLPAALAPGRISTSPDWYDNYRPLIKQRCAEVAA